MRELLSTGLKELGLSPTGEQLDKLEKYARLLLEQNQVMNLTAITEPTQVAQLHFLDSAAILGVEQRGAEGLTTKRSENAAGGQAAQSIFAQSEELGPEASASLRNPTWLSHRTVIDVGTGAGFPGMVLKILEPSLSLTLADSLGKRIAWLERVCADLSLEGVRCLHVRAEELALEPGFRDSFDLAVSRAVAAYPLLCELCLPFVRVGGVFLAMKSVESDDEIQRGQSALKRLGGKALGRWDYTIPGTGVVHRLALAEKTAPTPKGLPRSWGKIKKSPL